MGVPTGGNLGRATGSIRIDTSQAQQAPGVMQGVAQGIERAMASVNASTNKAQVSLSSLAGAARGVAGAFGVSLGIEGIAQLTRAAVAAADTATAYRRQNEIAVQLAGNQERLNTMVTAFKEASGGAVDEVTALSQVLTLLSTGLAKTPEQMEKFARAARGISIAKGLTTQSIVQQLGLESLNQTGMRLDQLGLDYQEVRRRAAELRAENGALSKEQAYANAVLDVADQKYGKLADSAAGQAVGTERVATATKNFTLALGQLIGPLVNVGANLLADDIERETKRWKAWHDTIVMVAEALNLLPATGSITSRTGIGANVRQAPQTFARFTPEQEAAILRRDEAQQEIEREANERSNEETEEYSKQRADIIADYEQQISRDAEDFARQRANAERKLAMDILDIAQDSARQRVKWEADLARTIAQAQADSGDRDAEAREDANKRLADLDEDFKREQERREADFRNDMLSAAGSLNAIELLELRQNRARDLQDAKRNHNEQKRDIQEQLEERLDDEAKALAKSIRQQNEAHDRQLADQAENDRLRVQDMKDAFAAQKAQEDIERGIRLDRQAQDHQAQLTALDVAHQDRLTQIGVHAQQDRDKIDEEFGKSLEALGIRVDKFIKEGERATTSAIENFDKWLKHVKGAFKLENAGAVREDSYPSYAKGGYVSRDSLAMVHRGEYVVPRAAMAAAMGGGGRSVTVGSIQATISIGNAGGRSDEYIMKLVEQGMIEAITKVAG